jgi:cytoskeletal protein CcmA (bactofilin family)
MLFGKRKKQKLTKTKLDSLIGQHSQVAGDIRFSGGLHVDGTVRGNVTADDEDNSILTLSDRGTIEGDVRVAYVILNGVVIGDVHARQHVELASSARVEGDVYYNLIEMAMGAEVNGQLVHTSEQEREPLALAHEPTVTVPEEP